MLTQTLTLGYYGMQYLRYAPPFQMFVMGSAFIMAVDDVRREPNLLTNHRIEWILGDAACHAPTAAARLVGPTQTVSAPTAVDRLVGPT